MLTSENILKNYLSFTKDLFACSLLSYLDSFFYFCFWLRTGKNLNLHIIHQMRSINSGPALPTPAYNFFRSVVQIEAQTCRKNSQSNHISDKTKKTQLLLSDGTKQFISLYLWGTTAIQPNAFQMIGVYILLWAAVTFLK